MMLIKWEHLPAEMQIPEVWKYYEILKKKQFSLFLKRIFDIIVSSLMLVILSPVFLILAIAIKIDSKGPVFFRQVRVTQYGRCFRIFKFRSMVRNADSGSQITVNNDIRVTRVGRIIRRLRLDEMSQLINVLYGDMTFVGTRPEVPSYVIKYSSQMMATLLLPAGVTNEACIYYKDEEKLLSNVQDVDKIYMEKILPYKMFYNLKSIEKTGILHCIIIMTETILTVFGKKHNDKKFNSETIVSEYVETKSKADII